MLFRSCWHSRTEPIFPWASSPKYKHTAQNNKLKPKINFLLTINSSCRFANGARPVMQKHIGLSEDPAGAQGQSSIGESSGDEDSSLSEGNSSNSSNSNSSSSDSTLSSVSGSSGTRSEISEVSSVDSTSIIDDLLGIVAQVHDQMEIGMEDNTIQWGKRLLIQDLSDNHALSHFCFHKVHLQEVADKLLRRLHCFLRGHSGSIKVNSGNNFCSHKTLLLHVIEKL